jgi:hypothetical protein
MGLAAACGDRYAPWLLARSAGVVPGGPSTTSPSSAATASSRSRSNSASGVASWAGVPARAIVSAKPAGELVEGTPRRQS